MKEEQLNKLITEVEHKHDEVLKRLEAAKDLVEKDNQEKKVAELEEAELERYEQEKRDAEKAIIDDE